MTTGSSNPPQTELGQRLKAALPDLEVRDSQEFRAENSRDHTEDLQFLPDVVVLPKSTEEVAALMRWAHAEQVPVTAAGAWTGLSGGALPVRGGISLSTRRLNRILRIDELHHQLIVQPGVIVQEMQEAVQEKGLFYAVDPASRGTCTIGGNLAENSGGPRAVKYGVTKDWVLNLEVVMADGTVIRTGANTLKNSTGYNLTQLMVGSEGTLGIITEAWIRLHARPRYRSSVTVKFDDFITGARAVRALSQGKLYPVNCRLVSRMEAVSMGLGDGRNAMLLLGFESERYPQKDAMAKALDVCREHGGRYNRRKVMHTESRVRSGAAGNWRNNFIKAPYIRDIMARKGMVTETLETAVTWDQFESFHQSVIDAAQRAFDAHCRGRGLITCRFTHIYPDGPAPYYSIVAWSEPGRQLETWDAIKASVSDAIIDNGGTITHHHAVGRDHRPWYERERGGLFTKTLTGLKSTLDPKWILNPGVLLEER